MTDAYRKDYTTMKLTLTLLALIGFANVPAFAGGTVTSSETTITRDGCEFVKAENGNYFYAVNPGCPAGIDGSKGTGGLPGKPPEKQAPTKH